MGIKFGKASKTPEKLPNLAEAARIAQLMQNSFRAFADTANFISTLQGLEAREQSLKVSIETLTSAEEHAKEAKRKAEESAQVAVVDATNRTEQLDKDYNTHHAELKGKLQEASDRVDRKINELDERAARAEEAHEARRAELQEEIDSLEAKLAETKARWDALKTAVGV